MQRLVIFRDRTTEKMLFKIRNNIPGCSKIIGNVHYISKRFGSHYGEPYVLS